MTDFSITDAEETPYLYVERSCARAPEEIGAAMSSAFGEVFGFMQAHGITPAGAAISVYTSYAPDVMEFRAGFIIARDDMGKADGAVQADVTPAGRAVHGTHTGSYAKLRDSYGQMHGFVTAEGLTFVAPTWEVYMNDPSSVPEDELVTELYQAIKD